MSTQTIPKIYRSTMAEQAPLAVALASLAAEYSDLPAAYITVHDTHGYGIDLQFTTAHDFEAWREALRFRAESVRLHVGSGRPWLAVVGEYRGVRVVLSGFNVPVSAELAAVPQVAGVAA